MKYKDLFKTKQKLESIAIEFKMSNWEKRKAISISKVSKKGLVDAYYTVINCRGLMGALA